MKPTKTLSLTIVILLLALTSQAAMAVVRKPAHNPDTTLVFDYAGVIEAQKKAELCDSLRSILRDTGVEVAVVTVETLDGMKIEDYAQTLFRSWGIGDKKRNDGILILVKPKTGYSAEKRGQVRIQTGTHAEGFLPDIRCKQIQNGFMLPAFKRGNYAKGIMAAVKEVKIAALKEYNPTKFAEIGNEPTDPEATKRGSIFYVLAFLLTALAVCANRFFPADDGYPRSKSPLLKAQKNLNYVTRIVEQRKKLRKPITDDDNLAVDADDPDDDDTDDYDDWDFGGGDSDGGGASSSW